MEGQDTIGQVRVDVAELKGILTTIVTDYGRRLVDLETAGRQLRIDLTAVKDQMDNRINTLVEKGNTAAADIRKELTTNTNNIKELQQGLVDIRTRQFSLGTRLATYISPFIAGLSLLVSLYYTVKLTK